MRTPIITNLACALVLPLVAGPLIAQETAFTYQGVVNFDGAPLDQRADFRFSLWDAATEGKQMDRPVEILEHPVLGGLLSVDLDFGLKVFEGGEARWLQIEARAPAGTGTYETLTPRRSIGAAPYALFALSGNEGPIGPQGETGPPGPKGDPGEQGPPGATPWELSGSTVSFGGGEVRIDDLAGSGLRTVKADANGTLTAASSTSFYAIPPAAFTPESDSAAFIKVTGTGQARLNSGGGGMSAAVHLPHGAVVTRIDVYYSDSSSSDMTHRLRRKAHTAAAVQNMASVTPTGNSGVVNLIESDFTTSISSATINNDTYSYYFRVFSNSWDGSNLGLSGVKITYQEP